MCGGVLLCTGVFLMRVAYFDGAVGWWCGPRLQDAVLFISQTIKVCMRKRPKPTWDKTTVLVKLRQIDKERSASDMDAVIYQVSQRSLLPMEAWLGGMGRCCSVVGVVIHVLVST
ncbi:hypothetical protein BKA66DRAFT_476197 [Pyrenochaeta sp. MPI-SDFR-AT-0127]|nr:hypothetical protein BKA66DRAFT_476197 [Pyrenochaeta sp. MPI-SDFR-AT-0127]